MKNKSKLIPTYRFKKLDFFTISILLFIAIACGSSFGSMINNGDYVRVFRNMSIIIEDWQPLKQCYPMGKLAIYGWLPLSTMSAFGLILSFIQKTLGSNCFHIQTIFYTLSFIFFSGLFRLSKIFIGKVRIIVFTLFVFTYLSMSFYFNSLYEEAIILALSPWLLWALYLSFFKNKNFPFLLLGAFLLFSKAQAIFFLPLLLLPFLPRLLSPQRNIKIVAFRVCVILILSSAVTIIMVSVIGQLALANSYNRFFNGIGWSLQDVASWPAKTFGDRHPYYYSNNESLLISTNYLESIQGLRLYGTSWEPDGKRILNKVNATDQDKIILANIRNRISYYGFFHFFVEHPETISAYLQSVYRVTLSSDYSLNYLRVTDEDGEILSKIVVNTSRLIMKNFGFIFATTGFIILIFAPNLIGRICVLYYFLGSPLFVVIGDGYYEFEKHAIPYFMLMPSFVFAILYFSRWSQGNPSNSSLPILAPYERVQM
jgi:hypothetical protein